jgi:hypothetical protein
LYGGFDGRGEAIKVANVLEYAYHVHRNKICKDPIWGTIAMGR